MDIDAEKVARLKKGDVPIYEPGLSPIVTKNFAAAQLDFTTDPVAAILHGELIFIAVGTPPGEDGSADLSYVLEVAGTIGRHLGDYAVVVNKSTVPVGTAGLVRAKIKEQLDLRGVEIAFDVASNPEFLKEGNAIEDCMRPDRIVVGSSSSRAIEILRKLYAPFNRNHERLVVMDECSAELTKYAANAMLATKISFMNEIANIAEKVGADVELVRQGIGSDPRIGFQFIYPGAGYGGSCFPKDVKALGRLAKSKGYNARLLSSVEEVNEDQKRKLFSYIEKHFSGDLNGKTIAVWGLAFKPDTDDMREASSRSLIDSLIAAGAKVRAFDPEAIPEAKRIYRGSSEQLHFADNAYEALQNADALAIVTEWKIFRSPNFKQLADLLKHRVVFDGRNIYDPKEVEAAGIAYFGVGRGRSLDGN
ncbi:UDP-glucose 6-dehydrogenase [Dyella flagellata]|uniref:UDP-glucose 6-dehydrogenase n=1 Tax=Dyella flagellata TaxID=1867833 RepID=A0ABQ5X932_9GAMM|nr:UDP-glucose 6-dehydrogenase [Dyella flagellata]